VKNTLNRRHETKYNITANDYDTMLKEQNHKCKICLISFLHTKHSTKPFIDHCHTTNKVRGLLCLHCNAGLGYFKDDVDVLQKATTYLNYFNGDKNELLAL
jgi:hypothetical protein